MAKRELPRHTARWLLLSIPIGTVWPEEAVYRATLGTAAEQAFGPTRGRLLQAAAFGLWHIVDARITGQPVIGTVLLTGVAGWFFGWLHARSGSLAAPMLVHLAVNESAGVAALAVQRLGSRE
jgi:membrane protease YdiL (CAAX protease family)